MVGRNSRVGELTLERLPQPSIQGQAGAGRVCFTPENSPPPPSLSKGLGASCPAWCLGSRSRGEGAASSFSCGLQKLVRKAEEYEIHVQESQR